MDTNCKICDAKTTYYENDLLRMLTPSGYPLSGELKLSICNECSFISNLSSSTEKDYDNYYKTLNKHDKRSKSSVELDYKYFIELFEKIISITQQSIIGKEVLDFGSAAEILSQVANKFGVSRVVNFDYGKEDINLETNELQFDLIVTTHTFEHILNPKKIFKKLLNLMREGSLIAVAVPDFSNYLRFYYGPFSHFDLEHINHFSERNLIHLFNTYNLEILGIRKQGRLVQKSLEYSEILIVGRKKSLVDNSIYAKDNYASNIKNELDVLFNKYHEDIKILKKDFIQHFKEISKDSVFGFYGMSAYTFRFFSVLDSLGLLSNCHFFADSDQRLSKFNYYGKPIVGKEEFFNIIRGYIKSGVRVYIFVCVINYIQILEMLEVLKLNPLVKVIKLGPETQNRLG